MNIYRNQKFEIIVSGELSGAPAKWKKTRVTVNSIWSEGSDGEKFEVLAAIRRTYNPEIKSDIRGLERQTPAQIGRCEGFRELKYQRANLLSDEITIVSGVMPYLSLVPTSRPSVSA